MQALTVVEYDDMVDDHGQSCPECGVSMQGRDPFGHALSHWPERIPDDPKHVGAQKRQEYLYILAGRVPAPV